MQMCENGHLGAHSLQSAFRTVVFKPAGQNPLKRIWVRKLQKTAFVRVNSEGKPCFVRLLFHLNIHTCVLACNFNVLVWGPKKAKKTKSLKATNFRVLGQKGLWTQSGIYGREK